MRTTATQTELTQALEIVNLKYNGNIRFKRLDQANSKRMNFTLTVNSSKEAGGRIGQHGRRIAAACWHVHGDFFDALFSLNPTIVVTAGGNQRITKQAGNWVDRNIGSQVFPLYYSEACECRR